MSTRQHRIRELYEAALKRPIGERAAFVAAQAGRDEDLQLRVTALLEGQIDTQLTGYDSDDSASVLAKGTEIGQYRIDGPLGAGGMGVVYRATDSKLNRPAAIKVLPESLADPEARRRFQREAQMASSLNHPHIVTVYDAGEYHERQYLITEYVDGGTLRQWAARPRGWLAITELLIGVADAVAAAHEAGILHRDIKPENILLAKNGYAKLADFGLAKLFEVDALADDPAVAPPAGAHSTLTGTAAYMSPEQAAGLPLDGRSDVYSFGLVLHELLSGVRPSPTRVLSQTDGTPPEPFPPLPEEVPAELRTVVAKALERNPADRYQTMRDLVVDLRRLVRRSATEAYDTARAGTARRALRIRYAVAGAAAAAALLIGVYGLDSLRGSRNAQAVAVLPFVNETGDRDDDYISEGVGDTLRDRLMELPGLEVQARASSVSFRNSDADIPTIARRLGVSVLVNGSVRKQGDVLEVLVELLDENAFAVRPSLRFRRLEGDFQALQQEIAAEISMILAPEAEAVVASRAQTPTSASETATMLVMYGSHLENQVKEELTVDVQKLDRAIDFYERAARADPTSIAAHGRLAGALIYIGDVEKAAAPLLEALELADAAGPRASPAELSDVWYSAALYRLRLYAEGVDAAYERALELNPGNVDALGGYAQWLMSHHRSPEADWYYKEAIRLDVQSLARYVDYAEYLGTGERMDDVRALAAEIAERFPDARGSLKLARVYEVTGDLDVGIAWSLKAFRAQPDDAETRAQIAELYARIGDFTTANAFEPEPWVNKLYFQRDWDRLIEESYFALAGNPGDSRALYFLAFAYNAVGDFALAKDLLEANDVGSEQRRDPGDTTDAEAMIVLVDSLQNLPGNEDKARRLAEYSAWRFRSGQTTGLETSWWINAFLACAEAQLGRIAESLEALDRVRNAHGLVRSPLILDSPCFKPLAREPGYQALVARLEERQAELRARLPATLAEHGVADVRP